MLQKFCKGHLIYVYIFRGVFQRLVDLVDLLSTLARRQQLSFFQPFTCRPRRRCPNVGYMLSFRWRRRRPLLTSVQRRLASWVQSGRL